VVIARELWAMRVIVNVFSIEASGWTDLIHGYAQGTGRGCRSRRTASACRPRGYCTDSPGTAVRRFHVQELVRFAQEAVRRANPPGLVYLRSDAGIGFVA
jgi:hypothetical protein